MLNDTLFSELVEASRDLPGNRWSVGGNAPAMAGRMATEGCDVLLGGSFSSDFTDVLSQHITGTIYKQTHFVHAYHLLSPRDTYFKLLFPYFPSSLFPTASYSFYFSISSGFL